MTVTTGVPTLIEGRKGRYVPFLVGAALVVVMALLPLRPFKVPPGWRWRRCEKTCRSVCMGVLSICCCRM